jgi:hypothetical protein
MADPALLFLTAERLTAYRWHGGHVSQEGTFAADEAGRRAFAAYAADTAQRRRTAWMLADLVEEDFRFETVPHLIGPERSALLARKLEQFYRSTPFRHAEIREREREGRRDDRVLFSALTNPGWIAPWIELLVHYEIPLRGLYSVPLLSRHIARLISGHDLLLITWERDAGVRQTYFKNGHVSFSRLSPLAVGLHAGAGLHPAAGLPSTGGAQFTATVIHEAARTVQYLHSLSLLPSERPLHVAIVCSREDREALAARLQDSPRVRYAYLDIGELAARLGYRDSLPDSDATSLLLHTLIKSRPHNQYASAQHTHYYALGEVRRLARAAVLVTGLGLLLWAGLDVWQAMTFSRRAEQFNVQLQGLERQYQAIRATFPPTPWSASEMRQAVRVTRALAQSSPLPVEVLSGIGQVLERFPELRLTQLSWQITAHPDSVERGTPARSRASTPPAGSGPTLYRVVLLQGEVHPFRHNYREALEQVEALAAELTRRGFSVERLELPLDLRPQASLAGQSDAPEAERRAAFALKIVREAT